MDVSNNSNVLAQFAHAGWGGFLTLLLTHFHVAEAWAWVLALAVVKETLESLGWAFWEPKQPWIASGLVDVVFWVLGIAAAELALRW